MKKIIAPIVNIAFLIPMLAIAMGSIELIARSFDLLPDYIQVFEVPYIFIIIIIIISSGIPLFWFANQLMRSYENYERPSIHDHLRHSVIYYIIIIYALIAWILIGFVGSDDNIYFTTGLCISIVAIVINYLYLFKRQKERVNNKL